VSNRHAVLLGLSLGLLALVALGGGRLADPEWPEGVYDHSDYDDRVSAVLKAADAMAPPRQSGIRPALIIIGRVLLDRATSARVPQLPPRPPRSPPILNFALV
jgi:hypothetical protein